MITENDFDAIALLDGFIPQKVFDAHAHLLADASPAQYEQDLRPLLGENTLLRVNFMPMPQVEMKDRESGLREKANAHLVQTLAEYPQHTGCAYIMHGDSEEEIWRCATMPGVRGLKCYCLSANTDDYESCAIGDFLPEAAWEAAQALELPIILHMMRPAALSDESNFSYVTTMSHRYPKAKLVLAHCARGFASWTVVDKIKALEDKGNIWFDMAAICESPPIAACILKNAGKRTLWGSDYPICMMRGKAISMGTNFFWFTEPPFPKNSKPCLVAAENLLAFRQAAVLLSLDQTQIDDLFYNNAVGLFCKGEAL